MLCLFDCSKYVEILTSIIHETPFIDPNNKRVHYLLKYLIRPLVMTCVYIVKPVDLAVYQCVSTELLGEVYVALVTYGCLRLLG